MRTVAFVCCTLAALLFFPGANGQVNSITPDHIYHQNIATVKLTPPGEMLGLPILSLNSGDQLELQFDDLQNEIKSYFYTLQLCNADWTPAQVNTIDYLRGFSEVQIRDYRFSSVALQKYVHYKARIPSANSTPTRSGNYLLKVYLDGDTNRLAFTRRLMVINSKAGVAGWISQPTNPKFFRNSQKINVSVNTKGLNVQNPFDQVKIVIQQNFRWDNAITNIKPMFIKGDVIEYNAEQDCIFPAMKEWRWVDLRSFRLQTERVQNTQYLRNGTVINVMPDAPRDNQIYQYLRDINGMFDPSTIEDYNIQFEGDYARVNFNFPMKEPFAGYDMYIFGELTQYEVNDRNKMTWNGEKGAYEGALFLKQGYYNYVYGLVDRTNRNSTLSTELTEGNWWETENAYTILVYYRTLGGRHDELVGMLRMNSLTNRQR